jgi:predicted phosphate transport protein (TIGR00153 family)
MIRQYGVLAYDYGEGGELRFLLITSRRTRRWIIPRGNPIAGLSPAQSAAQEAYEEAGLTGFVSAQEIGSYRYDKLRKNGSVTEANVHVFPLRATIQSGRWPERHQRDWRWFSREEAAAAVAEPGLRDLLLGFTPPPHRATRRPLVSLSAPPSPRPRFSVLGLFKRIMPKETGFFDMFARHAETLVQGADTMVAMLSGEKPIEQSCQRITDLEHQADDITREVLLAVRKSFITPFDRSAITGLVNAMDDAIDEMRQTAKTIMLYDVRAFEPPMCEMAALGAQAARLVGEAVPLLRSLGRNAGQLDRITENIVHLEGAADDLYGDGLKALFQAHGETRPMAYFIGREIYIHLERVLDGFEDVANEIQGIVIDHA